MSVIEIERLLRVCELHYSLFSNPLIVDSLLRACKCVLGIEDCSIDYGSAYGIQDWDPATVFLPSQPNDSSELSQSKTSNEDTIEGSQSVSLSQSVSSFSPSVPFRIDCEP